MVVLKGLRLFSLSASLPKTLPRRSLVTRSGIPKHVEHLLESTLVPGSLTTAGYRPGDPGVVGCRTATGTGNIREPALHTCSRLAARFCRQEAGCSPQTGHYRLQPFRSTSESPTEMQCTCFPSLLSTHACFGPASVRINHQRGSLFLAEVVDHPLGLINTMPRVDK
jgi:hypothetical protein